jgi:hypothetical protein
VRSPEGYQPGTVNPLPRWRVAAGCLVLAALVLFGILFAPVYIRNLKLQNYVDALTHRVGTDKQSDADLRGLVLDQAHRLALPVTDGDVHIFHTPEGLHIDVQYAVTITAAFYQVKLHFYPGAGSR